MGKARLDIKLWDSKLWAVSPTISWASSLGTLLEQALVFRFKKQK